MYHIKYTADSQVNQYKASLVAKSLRQRPVLDYIHMFSPIIKLATIRLLLSIVVASGLPMKQLDTSNTYLHDSSNNEVFMLQPQGYVDQLFLIMCVIWASGFMVWNEHLSNGSYVLH